VASRGDDGRITFADWHPVGVEEYGYVAPDPLDPNIVYGGKVSRYDRRTGDVQSVGPRVGRGGGGDYRTVRTAPVVFSTVDPTAMYFASNVVWKTTTGGKSWTQISSDLTRKDSIVPANVGTYSNTPVARARHGGVVYTVAPSYVNVNRIWAGSDDGLIHTTADGGKTWTEVTPPDVRAKPWSKISIIDAGRFDAQTAYAAVNTIRLDDHRPHIYRTHDGGKTWTHITNGIADGSVINTVREDPKRRGLLYAGSENQVWVSFDDGDNWSSLRLNMPATSIRDLVVKDDDIAVGTHGRSFWILDDVEPLRQLRGATASSEAVLFKPAAAYRFRWSKYTDTPLPPDEPYGQNPPDGAIIDYYLGANVSGDAKLEIVNPGGRVVRVYSSRDTSMAPADLGNVPAYWIRPTKVLSAAPGFHRFVWDVHFAPPAGTSAQPGSYPISATPGDTPREPRGPWALPGQYTIRLSVGGKTYTQPLTIKMDPRVKTSSTTLAQMHATSMRLFDAIASDSAITEQSRALRTQLRDARTRAASNADATRAIDAFEQQLNAIVGQAGGGRGGRGGGRGGGAGAQPTLASMNGELLSMLNTVEDSDVAPTTTVSAAVANVEREFSALVFRWSSLRGQGLSQLNGALKAAGLGTISLP